MIRFIWNFILFGFIFFLLHRFFPDAFDTLVGWMDVVWDYIVEIFQKLVDRIKEST